MFYDNGIVIFNIPLNMQLHYSCEINSILLDIFKTCFLVIFFTFYFKKQLFCTPGGLNQDVYSKVVKSIIKIILKCTVTCKLYVPTMCMFSNICVFHTWVFLHTCFFFVIHSRSMNKLLCLSLRRRHVFYVALMCFCFFSLSPRLP